MHLTRTRLAAVALVSALALAACGQVTGLSDDYTYDLEGGASADGAAGDATKSDGATEAGDAGVDATNKCTTAQTVAAAKKLNTGGLNGTQICKSCLAASCCTDIDTCTTNPDCTRTLGCKLDCTEKQPSERPGCFKSCSGGTPSTVFQSGIAQCSAGACATQCGFQ